MPRYFDPSEMSDLEAAAQRRQAYEMYRATVSPRTAQTATALAAAYPTMRPGEVLPLAKADVQPETPVAQAAAKASAKRGWGWHSIGDAVSGAVGKFVDAAAWVGEEVIADPIKGISRGMDIGLSSVGQTFQGAFRESVADGDIQGAEWLLGLPHLRKGFQQSTAATAIDEIRREGITGADYGSGFFAGGDVRANQVQRARAAAPLINGKAVTIGRYSAAKISEPGTRWHGTLSGLIDMGVALGSDPTSFVAGGARKGLEAQRTFVGSKGPARAVVAMDAPRPMADAGFAVDGQGAATAMRPDISAAGGLDGAPRKTVLPERVAEWLDGKEGRRIRQYLAAETNFERMRKLTKGKVDVETLVKLTDAKTDAEILDILGPQLGVQIREKFGVSAAALAAAQGDNGFRARRVGGAKSRLASQMPGDHMDLIDPDVAVDTVEKLLTNVKMRNATNINGMTGEQRLGYWTERMARATDRNGRFAVTREMLGEVRDFLLAEPMDEATTALRNTITKKKSRATRLANQIDNLDPGETRDALKAELDAVQDEIVSLEPQFKKATKGRLSADQRSALTRMYADYDERLRVYAINEIGDNATIPGAIIGGDGKPLASPHLYNEYVNTAVPLPDVRELRRATSKYVDLINKAKVRPGYDGINALADFTTQKAFKPLVLARGAWTVRVVGEEQIRLAASGLTSMFVHPLSHIAMALGKKGGKGITGDALIESDEMQAAMSRASQGFSKDGKVIRTRHRQVIDRNDPKYKFDEALLDEIGKLNNDPIMRRVLNGLGPGDVHPNTDLTGIDAVKDWFFNGSGRKLLEEMANADVKGDRAWLKVKVAPDGSINSADGYIDSLFERAKTTAGGDQRLLDAIATGVINGKPLSMKMDSGARKINRAALDDLRKLLDEGAGPQKVPADMVIHAKNDAGSEVLRMYDGAVEVMFNTLMSRPTNFLSRSPAFQQFYWKRQAELIERMTPETQQQALRVAQESGLSKQIIRDLKAGMARGSGDLNVADADLVAKGFALDSTRKLLYDLSDRSQFFDITRAIFPFGEAWKEVATTWARIGVVENPVALRRAQQVVTGLRSADADGDGQGFFYTDPQTGEEVFNYPFSGWINEKLSGVPAPLQASVKGLNIFSTSVIPGVGPVVQIPAGRLLPNKPQWDEIRTLVLPFGERNMEGGIAESFLPAWMQKARVALGNVSPDQERMYANTVMDTARYLVSTGKYSMDSKEQMDRTLEAAEASAKKVYGFRALAQFFVPSPPSPEFVTRDKDGRAMMSVLMVEKFRELQDQDYTTATEKFIEMFGEDAFLTTVSKTTGGGPPTDEQYDFIREHPEIPRQHADVYNYFLPQGGEFNFDAYSHQLRSGERKPITPKEALEIANQRLGAMVYRQAQAKVTKGKDGKPRPTEAERLWLAEIRDGLAEEYPGYNPTPRNLAAQKDLIQNLIRAARNPVLANTEAGKGLALYLKERDDAIRIARDRGLVGFASAKAAADIREALRAEATEIGKQYPDFIELFDRTFNREMISSDVEAVA